ncbi:alpha/beta fold hydrolase [Acidisoma cladoniae]|uniref:alpha/beta fold hydrolase n=1 Tax=Acidisoma cladoniae TaxID=3040935 RepID=UPI00254A9FDD|nr:alpha/beta fold hydrolase [Acidisoma sp. PAMC 29798]
MNIVSRQNATFPTISGLPSPRAFLRGRFGGPQHRRPHARMRVTDGVFVMSDGALLPYREWLPDVAPDIVILALHGINDSADAWEAPSGLFVDAGIAVIAPDQRGFGAAAGRGRWHGTEVMVDDALTMVDQTRARFPDARLYLAGESMGAAVLMVLAAKQARLAVDGYILSAPAVWGRREMGAAYRMSLWLAHKTVPWLRLSATGLGIKPSDNNAVLRRSSHSGVAIRSASIDALKGLADLMDEALAAAGNSRAPTLFLYGGRDQLVPKHAMASCWRVEQAASGRNQVFAFYPNGYHLLQRDHAGAVVTRDIVNWLSDAAAPLPSGADAKAADWLEGLAA